MAEGTLFSSSVVESLSELLLIPSDSVFDLSVERVFADVEAASKLSYAISVESCPRAKTLMNFLVEVYADGRFTERLQQISGINTLKVSQMAVGFHGVHERKMVTISPTQPAIIYMIEVPGTLLVSLHLIFLLSYLPA